MIRRSRTSIAKALRMRVANGRRAGEIVLTEVEIAVAAEDVRAAAAAVVVADAEVAEVVAAADGMVAATADIAGAGIKTFGLRNS